MLTLSSGIVGILEQNQSSYFLSMNIQIHLSLIFVCFQKLQKRSNVWIWRSPLLKCQTLCLETSHRRKQSFLLRRDQMLHYPVVIPLQIIYTGTVSIPDQLLNLLCTSLMVQQSPKSLM
ncbi:hypothetical protein PO909_031086 [Leuciscus waleckii]